MKAKTNPKCEFLARGGYPCNPKHPRADQLCKSCQAFVVATRKDPTPCP